jgi:FdhD protein
MNQDIKKLLLIKVSEQGKTLQEDVVVSELPLTISLNDRELATLTCSPSNLGYLAAGFLLSKGLIKDRQSIDLITVDIPQSTVWVEAKESKPSPPKKAKSSIKISTKEIFALLDEFDQRSELFKATGGSHGAALCNREKIVVFAEDISRHNAIDKVFGQCLLEGIETAKCLLITSGRVSSEVVRRVAKRNISMLISRAAPTDLGVKMAGNLSVTLIGFARDTRMNIYANDWRLKDS